MLLSALLFPAAKISPFGRKRWQPADSLTFRKLVQYRFRFELIVKFDWTVR